ncbi:MAG: transposase [Desulfobacteraceae bacterium]|nr:MAG: transposase [Desulfobacteraceae bacterium]
MPRQSRIDTPGALHHIICRGIEQRNIFEDDTDRDNFIKRLGAVLSETQTPCYAWALIPNHFHLLVRTGKVPVSTVMRRLLTGYAVSFNRRHKRSGHLFQNRYKSILCQEDAYLLELVRYIHLNPLRAGLVPDLKALSGFAYSGHSRIMGSMRNDWQDVDKVIELFGSSRRQALKKYEEFMAKGVAEGRKSELTGGGLIRSVGGWHELSELRKMKIHFKSDERVLGDSDFVKEILGSASEAMERKYRLKAEGYTFERIAGIVGEIFDIPHIDLIMLGKQPLRVKARSVLICWAVQELGMSATAVGLKLGMSQSAVSRAAQRGRNIVEELELNPEKSRNA